MVESAKLLKSSFYKKLEESETYGWDLSPVWGRAENDLEKKSVELVTTSLSEEEMFDELDQVFMEHYSDYFGEIEDVNRGRY